MKFTSGILIAALGLASGGNAAPASVPYTRDANANVTANITAPVVVHAAAADMDLESPESRGTFVQNEAEAFCQYVIFPFNLQYTYLVKSNPRVAVVQDVPALCGNLWDGLRRHVGCLAPSDAWCGEDGGSTGIVGWRITVSGLCNYGMVSSAWWEATHNKYGHLQCVGHPHIINLD